MKKSISVLLFMITLFTNAKAKSMAILFIFITMLQEINMY